VEPTSWVCDGANCNVRGTEQEVVDHVRMSENVTCTGALRVDSPAWRSWHAGIHPAQYMVVPQPAILL